MQVVLWVVVAAAAADASGGSRSRSHRNRGITAAERLLLASLFDENDDEHFDEEMQVRGRLRPMAAATDGTGDNNPLLDGGISSPPDSARFGSFVLARPAAACAGPDVCLLQVVCRCTNFQQVRHDEINKKQPAAAAAAAPGRSRPAEVLKHPSVRRSGVCRATHLEGEIASCINIALSLLEQARMHTRAKAKKQVPRGEE